MRYGSCILAGRSRFQPSAPRGLRPRQNRTTRAALRRFGWWRTLSSPPKTSNCLHYTGPVRRPSMSALLSMVGTLYGNDLLLLTLPSDAMMNGWSMVNCPRLAPPGSHCIRLRTALRVRIEGVAANNQFQPRRAPPKPIGPKFCTYCCWQKVQVAAHSFPANPFPCSQKPGTFKNPPAMAVPHKRHPTLYSMLQNLGPACTHAGCVGHRGPVSARHMHALRHGQHSLRSRSQQAVCHSMAFANLCAAGWRMGIQAQMVSDGIAHYRRAQRVG